MDKSIKYGVVFSEVSSPIWWPAGCTGVSHLSHRQVLVSTEMLTCFSLIQLQKLPLILPASLLRFVLSLLLAG